MGALRRILFCLLFFPIELPVILFILVPLLVAVFFRWVFTGEDHIDDMTMTPFVNRLMDLPWTLSGLETPKF